MADFKIYHVARNSSRHNSELDDRLYGTPLVKEEEDWTLKDPKNYIKRVKNELTKVNMAIDDMVYLMREKGVDVVLENAKEPTLQEADAHVFHCFTVRQFGYAEKLSQMLESKSPTEIELNIPKAWRQLNVLLAAREDLQVTLVRFTDYSKSK